MKKYMLLLTAVCLSGLAKAQTAERQVIGSSGTSFTGSGMQVAYTVGEAVTSSGTSGSFSVNQGFQQNSANSTGIKEHQVLVSFSLYPNPAQDMLTLTLTTNESFALKTSIINVAGQIIMADDKPEHVSNSYKREFSILLFSAGSYFINLYDSKNALLKSIPFLKQ